MSSHRANRATPPSPAGHRDVALRHGYDREATQYDARRYDSAEGKYFSALELRILRSWIPLDPSSKVLDLPAGTGRLSVGLAESRATVVGVDISANMLGQALAKRRVRPDIRVHFMQGNGIQLPFADDTFDAVVSFKFFHLIPNDRKAAFIAEMTRVLKQGAPLIVEFNSPFYGGVLAFFRYYFQKKHPGGMRTKCLFPDQVGPLFQGLHVTKRQGVKLPFSGTLAALVGQHAMDAVNLWIGSLPGARYLAYVVMIEARKPTHPMVDR